MLNEFSLREYALDKRNISFMLLGKKCAKARKCGSFKCNGDCVDRFPTSNEGFEAVKTFRHSLWIDPESLCSEQKVRSFRGLDIRKSALIKSLASMTVLKDSGDLDINFTIAGVRVCKDFFYRATGFSKKIFNRGVSFILNRYNDETDIDSYLNLSKKTVFFNICGHLPSFAQNNSNSSMSNEPENLNNYQLHVISFLDTFVSAHTDVDHAPEEGNVMSVCLNWNKVYEDYKEHCKLILVNPVAYPLFTSIR